MTLKDAHWRRNARRLALAVGCVALIPAIATQAQEAGGVVFTLGVDQRFQWKENPSLSVVSTGQEATSRTRLTFGAVTQTRTQRLAFSASGTLAAGDGGNNGFTLPGADLSYRLDGASSSFAVSAFLRESDVSTSDFATDFGLDGLPVVSLIKGTGTEQRRGGTVSLEFGKGAPFGGDFSLGLTERVYTGTTDPDLIDNRRVTAGLSLRFALSEVTTATAKLSASELKEVGLPAKRNESLALGLEHSLPNGTVTVNATYANLDTGNRRSLNFGRNFDLPSGKLSASFGLSQSSAIAGTNAVGSVNWQKDLPRGKLNFSVSRSITGNARDSETDVSSLSLGVTQDLAPRLGMTVTLGLLDSRDTLTDISTKSTTVDASLRYALTEDWGMNFGASHSRRNEDGVGRAKSSSVFLSLNRTFEFRP